MKILTKEEEQQHYNQVLKGGIIWGGVGLGASLAVALALQRVSPGYRRLTLPIKAFGVSSIATFALIIGADRYSRRYEISQWKKGGGSERTEEGLERMVGIQEGAAHAQPVNTMDRVLEWAKERRYSIIAGSWVASMVGSWLYISTKPLTFTQKLVQARMAAQALTLGVLVASAGIASIDTGYSGGASEKEDKERTTERQLYKFKKDSPFVKEEEERKKHAGPEGQSGSS